MYTILRSLDYNTNKAIMPSTFGLFGVLSPQRVNILHSEIPVYLISHSMRYCRFLCIYENFVSNKEDFVINTIKLLDKPDRLEELRLFGDPDLLKNTLLKEKVNSMKYLKKVYPDHLAKDHPNREVRNRCKIYDVSPDEIIKETFHGEDGNPNLGFRSFLYKLNLTQGRLIKYKSNEFKECYKYLLEVHEHCFCKRYRYKSIYNLCETLNDEIWKQETIRGYPVSEHTDLDHFFTNNPYTLWTIYVFLDSLKEKKSDDLLLDFIFDFHTNRDNGVEIGYRIMNHLISLILADKKLSISVYNLKLCREKNYLWNLLLGYIKNDDAYINLLKLGGDYVDRGLFSYSRFMNLLYKNPEFIKIFEDNIEDLRILRRYSPSSECSNKIMDMIEKLPNKQ